jgi:hypothetical protein
VLVVSKEMLPILENNDASSAFLLLAPLIREQYATYATQYDSILFNIKVRPGYTQH